MSEIWRAVNGPAQVQAINLVAMRIVESQEEVATLTLVDSIEEQHVLEQLIDDAKNRPLPNTHRLHYLLATPFRYPPLRFGSRFGNKLQTGIFYASLAIEPLLAECAYYRFVFWDGMTEPPPSGQLTTHHSVFKLSVGTEQGIRLEQPPFDAHENTVSHPAQYAHSQSLGQAMQEAGVHAFSYSSARHNEGINIGIFVPSAIRSRRPRQLVSWFCVTNRESVTFRKRYSRSAVYKLDLEQFLFKGRLPKPAVM